jgi:hypothetical protein
LLVEARSGHFQGDSSGFYGWATRKFGKSQATIRRYTAFGADGNHKSFKHLEDFVHTPKAHGGMGHTPPIDRQGFLPFYVNRNSHHVYADITTGTPGRPLGKS